MRLDLRGVHARHPSAPRGSAVLRSIDLHLASGEQVAVIGPSGAGKTTLMELAAASLRPGEGRIAFDETDPWTLGAAALKRQRGRLFLAPQTPPLPPRQRVVTAVLAGCLPGWSLARSLRSLFYPADIEGARAALAHFDLAEKLFARVDRLSGGERQRVGLARALMAPAGLWLIDEPLSALDPTRSRQALAALTGLARERGITLLATLHQVDMALAHFDRIVGLRAGVVAFDLPAAQVDAARLAALYAQHEAELVSPGAPPFDALPPTAAAPVLMQCR
ncbi:ATP-binding cassette domain-containing protein [Xylophilus rhododendri]|uniref:ATP-binding cassette domain-containing protein n=1 Tax=Xylophilus rhododendri TaxID=2697032 RepID=A0A857IZR5_9BURK|nr:ATP-binding cassette domain-containing protein [Xylophilus rhododendri]QHI97094.1 ATP-binding cassette domain-containing protein [Xylophilus rhododendri]